MTKKALITTAEKISIDLNCDLGEGTGNDAAIMPFISSANIACGYHAGDTDTMKATVELALRHQVAIGAHPSFQDRDNFGRTDIQLPMREIYDLVTKQVDSLAAITQKAGARLHHVKLHGALYNMAARTKTISAIIALAVKDVDEDLVLYGSRLMITEAKKIGLKTASEVFADRRYNEDGSLVSRKVAMAVIDSTEASIQQVMQMIRKGTVTTIDETEIPIQAETICIHGDGPHAIDFARAIHAYLSKEKFIITAPFQH
ncbi:MAG: 5-oxoprolinase subunit PxpA [Terrimonas sp.]|nr:5-oxoprolinase subunit PxpA [Terrimonas sp.]